MAAVSPLTAYVTARYSLQSSKYTGTHMCHKYLKKKNIEQTSAKTVREENKERGII